MSLAGLSRQSEGVLSRVAAASALACLLQEPLPTLCRDVDMLSCFPLHLHTMRTHAVTNAVLSTTSALIEVWKADVAIAGGQRILVARQLPCQH